MGPGSAAHRFALRSIRGTQVSERPGAIPAFFCFALRNSVYRRIPRVLDSISDGGDYWMPAFAGMTSWYAASLLRRLRSLQRRIIRIALRPAAVERRLVPLAERRALLQALDQIGVRDERLSERDEVGLVRREHLGREFEIVAVVGDIGAFEALAQTAVVDRRDVARAAGGAFDDVDVDELQRVEMIDDVVEQRLRTRVGNVLRRP